MAKQRFIIRTHTPYQGEGIFRIEAENKEEVLKEWEKVKDEMPFIFYGHDMGYAGILELFSAEEFTSRAYMADYDSSLHRVYEDPHNGC